MLRRSALIALFICLAAPGFAQSVKLKAHEIAALLTGNTAIGMWEGTGYRQYFAQDGATIYAQDNARATRGQWRIDTERDEFQSIWPADTGLGDADWEGWFVMEFAGDYYWVSKKTPPTPFRVVEGEQLVVVP